MNTKIKINNIPEFEIYTYEGTNNFEIADVCYDWRISVFYDRKEIQLWFYDKYENIEFSKFDLEDLLKVVEERPVDVQNKLAATFIEYYNKHLHAEILAMYALFKKQKLNDNE